MPSPFDKIEAEHKRLAEQAQRDKRELERILYQYQLIVYEDPEDFEPSDHRERSLVGIKEEAEAIIRRTGRPMQVAEIVEILAERGHEFEGVPSGITRALLRNPYLKYFPKVGWWLRHVEWPPKRDQLRFINERPPESAAKSKGGRRRTPDKEQLYQALRKYMEGRTEPVAFRELFDHVKELGIPIGGKDEKQNLSAFMTSIHEFQTHGPNGRLGWTFTADDKWSVVGGFRAKADEIPPWLSNPRKQKLFEAIRDILRGKPERVQLQELFEGVKKAGVNFEGVKNERDYLANFLTHVPCFERYKKAGWKYLPELDSTLGQSEEP